MLENTYPNQICSIARALEVVGERWTLLILRDAVLGATRFDQFQTSLGVATNVLSTRLERLCAEGLLERRRYQQRPERHEYLLTEKGRALAPALITLMKWGDHYYPTPSGPPRLTLHAGCGGQVDEHLLCRRCGERAEFSDLDVTPGPGLRSRSRP
jgi:DNA-binding HxlR family transcriptional regulator